MIKTVEQLAEVADSTIHRLGQGGVGLKTRAQQFLSKIGESDELKKENKKLRKKVKELEKKLEASTEKPARKRLTVAS
jgi:regulator of replication initiation timing